MSARTALAGHHPFGQSASTPGLTRGRPSAGSPQRRIRVVFFLDNMSIGGTELNALRTAKRLDPSRFNVSVACLQERGPLMSRYAEAGIQVRAFPIGRLYGLRALLQGIRIARFLASEQVDIVHSHDHYNSIFATIWARIAGTPVVIASRRWIEPPRSGHDLLTKFAYRLAHYVLTNNRPLAAYLRESQGVRRSRVVVVPNFVDESAFEAIPARSQHDLRYELGIPQDALVVGIVASLSPVKDHATLLNAIAELRPRWPDLHLIVVGDGVCHSQLAALAHTLGITDAVHFAGLRPNTPNPHHAFDVSVLCSTSEGFPNSILEAMAAGRPVVATDVGGNRDAVEAGRTGVLVPPRDAGRLGAAIEELLRQPELRTAMGRAARERAATQFNANVVVGSLESLYYAMLGRTEQ